MVSWLSIINIYPEHRTKCKSWSPLSMAPQNKNDDMMMTLMIVVIKKINGFPGAWEGICFMYSKPGFDFWHSYGSPNTTKSDSWAKPEASPEHYLVWYQNKRQKKNSFPAPESWLNVNHLITETYFSSRILQMWYVICVLLFIYA